MRKFTVFLSMLLILVSSCVFSASAQSYSTEYPNCGNSGSPYWIHCNLRDIGDVLIVLDPNINPQSFAFDTATEGYNLINNTGDLIVGRAYSTSGTRRAFNVRFPSFYRITTQTGTDANGQQTVFVDSKILDIYGTTLDLVDYTGTRGNDMYNHDITQREFFITIAALLFIVVLLIVISIVFKPKLFRM